MANNTWKNYTQKSTALSDNDEVMLLDSTDDKNKRGLMSKFWNYVVDKMSTAVISKLETNNKTIIGAINALNSDALGFNNGMISDYTIKNDKYYSILPLGCYELQNASLTYFPARWGILLHFRGDINYGIFIAIHTDGTVYVRLYSLKNNDWYTGWVKLAKG